MVCFSMYGSVMILPSLLQAPTGSGFGLGQSLLATGLCMAPGGVVMLLASPLSARLTAARDARTTLMTGTAILAVAYLLAPILMSAVWQVVLISVITGCGMALAFSAMPTLIMHSVPEHETAAANGLNALMRSLGTSISSAVMTVLLAGALLGASTGNAHGTGAGIRAFRIAFLVAAGAAALGSVLTLLLPRGTGRAQEPDEIDRELLAATAPGS
jgi:MFS family permease